MTNNEKLIWTAAFVNEFCKYDQFAEDKNHAFFHAVSYAGDVVDRFREGLEAYKNKFGEDDPDYQKYMEVAESGPANIGPF